MSVCIGGKNEFLIERAEFTQGDLMPILRPEFELPNRIVPFSKAKSKKWTDFDCWVCFYDEDSVFECLWNNPKQYLSRLKRFRGIISPDYSLSLLSPACYQQYQIFRGRALASWLQDEGVKVIPNIRYVNEASRQYCCAGISPHSIIAIGSYGCIQDKEKRKALCEGVAYAIETLHPEHIVVYGGGKYRVFAKYISLGYKIHFYSPVIQVAHEQSEFRHRQEREKQINERQGVLSFVGDKSF